MSRPPVAAPGPGEPHRNISSLAGALGVSIPTISAWRNRYPDEVPDTLHEEKWRELMKRRNLGQGIGRRQSDSLQAAQLRKVNSDARLNEIKIAKEERKLIPSAEVEAFLLYAASKTKSALYQMVAETAPKCAGLEAGEIRGIMRAAADSICLSMQTTVEDWQAEQEEARKAAEQATEAQGE